jgi:tRNA-modifying protein YgfZ
MNSRPFPLSALQSFAVTGADASKFLQGQLSSDLGGLASGGGQLSAWHDAKGRVLAILRVLAWNEGYLLVLPASLAASIMKRMSLFVLRAGVDLRFGPGVYGLRPANAGDWLSAAGLARAGARRDDAAGPQLAAMPMPADIGWLIAGEAGPLLGPPDAEAAAEWQLAELASGLPEIYPETSGEFVAQMLNLDRLGALSFTKGCYPGQEIIARTHHLGRVKRRARLFTAASPPPAPGTMLAGSGGAVVRAHASAKGCLLMAVVPEDTEDSFTLADGTPLLPVRDAG